MSSGKLQTLDRGIALLMHVAQSPRGLKIAELADRLGLHRPIAYRLVATLADHGMVTRLSDGRIVLGGGVLVLAAHAGNSLRALARPVVEDLADEVGATAFLSTAQGDECVAVLTAKPRSGILDVNYRTGTRHPLDKGAAGLAILAGRAPRADEPQAVTAARRNGFSITRGELRSGAVGVSSAVPMPEAGPGGFELSIGVFALDTLDTGPASKAVTAAARRLAAALDHTAENQRRQ